MVRAYFPVSSVRLMRWLLAALMLTIGWHGELAAQQLPTYKFDKDHTAVSFSWSHVGLSRQSARIMAVDGRIAFDPAAPEASKIDVVMKTDSIWTGISAFDEHLKSSDYFNVARFPLIQFQSREIRKMSDKTGRVVGDLTIMGITRPVTLDVIWNYSGEHPLAKINPNYRDVFVSGFSATALLRRSDWGLSLAVPLVSDEIKISIETELIRD
jgi:polyisoprenoid-binding protein YceI